MAKVKKQYVDDENGNKELFYPATISDAVKFPDNSETLTERLCHFSKEENDEFLHIITDSENRVLFGIDKKTGKPCFPTNDMYHVVRNEEYFAAWVDVEGHLLLAIRRDGQIEGRMKDCTNLKETLSQAISAMQSSLNTKVDKVDGKGLVDEEFTESYSYVEDPEGRMEVVTDGDEKVVSSRSSDGTKCEEKVKINDELILSDEASSKFHKFMKDNNYITTDLSDEELITIPRPKSLIVLNFLTSSLPEQVYSSVDGEVEVWDDAGHYFKKEITDLAIQGFSSRGLPKKNFSFDFVDCKIKIGDWVPQDSFHFKANYLDFFRGKICAAYDLAYELFTYKRPTYTYMPWYRSMAKADFSIGNSKSQYDFAEGARAMPDGFPILIYHNGVFHGLYTWQLKKQRDNYAMDKGNSNNIEVDPDDFGCVIGGAGSDVDWTKFEIRNPKNLICMDGSKYDGDNPKELIDESSESYDSSNKKHVLSLAVKNNITNFRDACAALKEEPTTENFEKYFDVDWCLDMILFDQVTLNIDTYSWVRNTQWGTWDGVKWYALPYDLDQIFGCNSVGDCINENVNVSKSLVGINYLPSFLIKTMASLYKDKLDARYKELMDGGVITVDNIIGKLQKLMKTIGSEWYSKEFEKWSETPSYRSPNVNKQWKFLGMPSDLYSLTEYSEETTYAVGDKVKYAVSGSYRAYECVTECQGVLPVGSKYTLNPMYGGFYDSLQRTASWLEKRIEFLNGYFNYNNTL